MPRHNSSRRNNVNGPGTGRSNENRGTFELQQKTKPISRKGFA